FIPLFLSFAFRSRNRMARSMWVAGSVLLALVTGVLVRRTTDDYRSQAVFNLVFLRLAPEAPDPLRALQELGLGKDDLPFLGMHAFVANGPMTNPEWAGQFPRRCNHTLILRYYLRHPSVPIRHLYQDLSEQAAGMRPFGNRSPDDGFKLDARATHFVYWSDFRSFLYRRAPWVMILLALATLGGAAWLLLRSPSDRAFAGLVLA